MKKRFSSTILTLMLLLASFLTVIPASAAKSTDWIATNPNAPTDYAYSFVFVGDTQILSMLDAGTVKNEYPADATIVYPAGDTKGSTNYMETLYGWIADNASDKKIKYVFGLGDITENIEHSPTGNMNTGNSATTEVTHQNDNEWSIAHAAISQLDGVVPYSMARGNHDTVPGFNTYFDNSSYKNMPGTTFIDWTSNGTSTEGPINLAREYVIGNDKFLMITLDYAPSNSELAWAKAIMDRPAYANHKVIITTHAYLNNSGALLNENSQYHTTSGDNMWNNYFSKCANLHMVVCGHVGVTDPVITYQTGVNGNVVTQILIDPQDDDIGTVNKNSSTGAVTATVDPTGMVSVFYFSEEGKVIDIEYISTIREAKGASAYLKEKNQLRLDYRFDVFNKLNSYGYKYYDVDAPIFTAPQLDGHIDYKEYSVNYRKTPMGSSEVSEYFAYDANNLYFGFAYKMPNEQTPTMKFTLTGSDNNDANAINDDSTYIKMSGSPVTADTNLAASAYDVSQRVDSENKIFYLEISVSIDAIQEKFKFAKQTIAYTLTDETSGNVRNCAVSSELAEALSEDFGTVSTLPQYVRYVFDARTAFKALGHKDHYIGESAKTATVNGLVGENEYSFKNTVAYNDTDLLSTPTDGDIDEYFAHDANNFYAAFVVHNAQYVEKTSQFLIHSLSADSYLAVVRYNFQMTLKEDGTVKIGGFKGGPALLKKTVLQPNANEYSVAISTNANDNTTTYELSFTKAGLKRILGVDTLDFIGYSFITPNSGSSWRHWHYGNNTASSKITALTYQWQGRTSTDNLFLPQYVRFSSEPVGDVEPISTYTSASVKISKNSGLRFGTEISTDYIEHLITTYGKENVSIGTLIVPADLLGSLDFNKESLDAAGIPYLDIKADIDTPYKNKGNAKLYTGSIESIKEEDLDRDFCGIGYIAFKYGGETTYVYSETYATRSVAEVAEKALNDVNTAQVGEYQYSFETATAGNYLYSKYTQDERKVLLSLIG